LHISIPFFNAIFYEGISKKVFQVSIALLACKIMLSGKPELQPVCWFIINSYLLL